MQMHATPSEPLDAVGLSECAISRGDMALVLPCHSVIRSFQSSAGS